MRHRKGGRKLGRTSSHRRAMLCNLVSSLLEHERITTTKPKAKEARKLAEKMITLAKKGSLHARRLALSKLNNNKKIVRKLFDILGPRYNERPGGYTRILNVNRSGMKAGSPNRLGDNAQLVIFELVDAVLVEKKKPEVFIPRDEEEATTAQAPAEDATPVAAATEEVKAEAPEEAPAEETQEEAPAEEAPEEEEEKKE